MSVVSQIRAEVQESQIEADALLRVARNSDATQAEKELAYAAALRLKDEVDRIKRQLDELAGEEQ
jgi:hypothetical protein